jgi:tRNA modification GTPase
VTAAPDTIAAVATPAGRGSIGVIRVSGPEVPRIAVALLGTIPSPRTAQLLRFRDVDGATLDQGVALYFPAPASFTGEHVLELQGHGGILVLDLLLQRVFALGCRPARPGEFSERAFLNGKMDVAQAEAVADLIDAATTAAARAAVRSIQSLQARLTGLRMQVEAAIDFPDEEVGFLSASALHGRLSGIFEAFDAIMSAARQGRLLREGLTVVIVGRPNAGKSSVLNRLVGDDVAIVTDLPGTTRDLLRHHLQLDGLPITLVDTAGLRLTGDVVEAEGIRRAKVEMRRADRILWVMDASVADTPSDLDWMPADVPVTVLMNKIDLVGKAAALVESGGRVHIHVSAQSGAGLDLVRQHLRHSSGLGAADSGALSARRRHLDALVRARSLVSGAAKSLEASHAAELFAEDLRLAQKALGEITGEFSSDELLGEIFSSFCIGK